MLAETPAAILRPLLSQNVSVSFYYSNNVPIKDRFNLHIFIYTSRRSQSAEIGLNTTRIVVIGISKMTCTYILGADVAWWFENWTLDLTVAGSIPKVNGS